MKKAKSLQLLILRSHCGLIGVLYRIKTIILASVCILFLLAEYIFKCESHQTAFSQCDSMAFNL